MQIFGIKILMIVENINKLENAEFINIFKNIAIILDKMAIIIAKVTINILEMLHRSE